MKVVQLHVFTPNQFSSPTPNPKIGLPKVKTARKLSQEDIENENCSTTWVDPKTVFELYNDPKSSPLGPQNVQN